MYETDTSWVYWAMPALCEHACITCAGPRTCICLTQWALKMDLYMCNSTRYISIVDDENSKLCVVKN